MDGIVRRWGWLAMVAVVLTGAAASARGSDAAAGIDSAVDLLVALEEADEGIRTFEAGLLYDRRFALAGDRHVRLGRAAFRVEDGEDGSAERTFAVVFDRLRVDGTEREIDERWVFDGRWLVEVDEEERRWTAREMAPEGETVDLLELGEGPLPLPVGQEAEEILARYEASLVGAEAGLEGESEQRRALVSGSYQLRLVPTESRRGEDQFREIRLWYERGTLLPVMAYTRDRAGDESYVVMFDAERNAEDFDGSAITTDPPEGGGWEIQKIEGRFADAAGDGDAG